MKTQGFMHSMNATKNPKLLPFPIVILICALTIVLGGVGGFMIVKKSPTTIDSKKGNIIQTNTSAGVIDKKTFNIDATGILREGGIEGEGNFHLERPGGVSQNAYLTSSTVDLSKYIGKKIKVWGQTYNAQKAGWLMDVGLVEIQ